ncbi:MAG: ATP-binding protein [Pseudomonadota bacterium]|nr:ATP-binding protein [Pseudomonadota bacterium]
MSVGFLFLRRLRIMCRGHAVYDQNFHRGVNIIRGTNSSGKSTVSDFIYFALGGENSRWKGAAKLCDQVQAELETPDGTLTLKRDTDKPTSTPSVFFGSMSEATQHGLDSWESFPLHRTERAQSFSQLLFRSVGIPEAISDGASNITMHQLLRLLYADQRTPTGHLFGFDPFDPMEIRRAVGDLICGLNPHEAYGLEIEVRTLKKKLEEKKVELRTLVAGLPDDEAFRDVAGLNASIQSLNDEIVVIEAEIRNVDQNVDQTALSEFDKSRRKALSSLGTVKIKIVAAEEKIEAAEFDLAELEQFLDYLGDVEAKAKLAGETADLVGDIDFETCPSCLKPLPARESENACGVCGQELDDDYDRSRYLAIRRDLEIQIRESSQLQTTKQNDLLDKKIELRRLRSDYQTRHSNFVSTFELTSSPREAYLAEKNWQIGSLTKEIQQLTRLVGRAQEVQKVSEEKRELESLIEQKTLSLDTINRAASIRRSSALGTVNSFVRQFLMQDLPNQDDFRNPTSIVLDFENNVVEVDGEINFSESSNVVLKNAAILSLLAAAAIDENFNHPRFVLMDNIEDKGMTQERSRNFQKIIVQASQQMPLPHQVIFTTSMMEPELEDDALTVGPVYSDSHKTLEFPDGVIIRE